MVSLGPRVVIAGVASGVGKTTIATGLMASLRGRGLNVANAKVGPDFIDPGYHSAATGRPGRNLDPWLCGPEAIPALAGRASAGADICVIEGVMGLFDGAADGSPSSTADVARLLDAPVILVVDAAAVGASIAAVVRGFRDHDPNVDLAGVICNRVGSQSHGETVSTAIERLGVPVVGCVPRDDALTWRDRHLGLVPVAEKPAEVRSSIERLAALVTRCVDLEAVERIARSALSRSVEDPALPATVGSCRIAVATGTAFTFSYTDNVEAMQAAGAEIVPFDPLQDPSLPADIDGLVIGGGFPELFGDVLADNHPMLADARQRITAGLVTWAECGGLHWLARELDGRAMVGVVPTTARLGDRLHLGYRNAKTTVVSVVGPAGTSLRGHEFHYSTCDPGGNALELSSPHRTGHDGWATPTLLATYLHHHAGGDPAPVEAFVGACVRR